jgi:hypothetical protein
MYSWRFRVSEDRTVDGIRYVTFVADEGMKGHRPM